MKAGPDIAMVASLVGDPARSNMLSALMTGLALTALAPGNPPSGPVFGAVQGIVLLFFIVMIVGAVRRFRPAV